jgi:alpha-L-rhamnosidase
VKASHTSPYGTVASAWTLDGSTFTLTTDVPANTHATIRLPRGKADTVTLDGKPLTTGNGVTGVEPDGQDVKVEVGSGHYVFSYAMPASSGTK